MSHTYSSTVKHYCLKEQTKRCFCDKSLTEKQKMKIDELPAELLIEIFSYLKSYDKVSLVNKQFYNVACKVNDSNICLWIDLHFFVRKCFVLFRLVFLIYDFNRTIRRGVFNYYFRALKKQIVKYQNWTSIYLIQPKHKCDRRSL